MTLVPWLLPARSEQAQVQLPVHDDDAGQGAMRLRGSNCWVRVGELPDNLAVPQRPMLPSSSYRCRWVAFSDHPGAPVGKRISFLTFPYVYPEPVLIILKK
jgi:hypothetical protein